MGFNDTNNCSEFEKFDKNEKDKIKKQGEFQVLEDSLKSGGQNLRHIKIGRWQNLMNSKNCNINKRTWKNHEIWREIEDEKDREKFRWKENWFFERYVVETPLKEDEVKLLIKTNANNKKSNKSIYTNINGNHKNK